MSTFDGGGVRAALRAVISPEIQTALAVRRAVPDWRHAGLVFVHVPKAAGTSICAALYGRFLGHATSTQIRRYAPDVGDIPSFAVTRNPWDRCVSAYRFAVAGAGASGLVARINRPEQYRIAAFRSFEAFVNEWLMQRDLRGADSVFRPQFDYVRSRPGTRPIDHVGKVEKLAATERYVGKVLGRSVVFGRHNVSGPPVEYREWYDRTLVRLVGDKYADDVAAFGYDF